MMINRLNKKICMNQLRRYKIEFKKIAKIKMFHDYYSNDYLSHFNKDYIEDISYLKRLKMV